MKNELSGLLGEHAIVPRINIELFCKEKYLPCIGRRDRSADLLQLRISVFVSQCQQRRASYKVSKIVQCWA